MPAPTRASERCVASRLAPPPDRLAETPSRAPAAAPGTTCPSGNARARSRPAPRCWLLCEPTASDAAIPERACNDGAGPGALGLQEQAAGRTSGRLRARPGSASGPQRRAWLPTNMAPAWSSWAASERAHAPRDPPTPRTAVLPSRRCGPPLAEPTCSCRGRVPSPGGRTPRYLFPRALKCRAASRAAPWPGAQRWPARTPLRCSP